MKYPAYVQRKNRETSYYWDHLRVSPACPPNTNVHIHGGWLYLSIYWWDSGEGRWWPSSACDFSDSGNFDNYTGTFVNAYYYHGVIWCIEYNGFIGNTPAYHIVSSGLEYETAGEAEDSIAILLSGTDDVYYEWIPIWSIVLRNDGRTGVDGAIQAIEAINRGKSYLWRDVRPRHKLMTA